MNRGKEVLQMKIEDQFAPHMPECIRFDAALADKPVDRGSPLIDRVQHLIQLPLNDLESIGRRCNLPYTARSLGNIKSAVIVSLIEVIAQQLGIDIEEVCNRVARRQGSECLAQCFIGGSQLYAQDKKKGRARLSRFSAHPMRHQRDVIADTPAATVHI